ncbi:MAG: hypothetical protein IKU54_04195 [Oscillospiraceae bacterium]|nr:hypothetical protein [Oscillospiraceae bacterium]
MKKLLVLFISVMIGLTMVACGGSDKDKTLHEETDSQITVTENGTTETSDTSVDEKPSESEETTMNGIRPEIKEALDSYEKFFDDYIVFINKYKTANSTEAISLMSDYARYMAQFAETMEAMEGMENIEMSDEEIIYYMEVTSRISRKLLAAA